MNGRIHEHFEAAAAKAPDSIALITDDNVVTYRELNRRANQLAHRLQRKGVGPESIVALQLDCSVEFFACVLGVWKAGGACQIIDPGLPAERRALFLAGAKPSIVVSFQSTLDTQSFATATQAIDDASLATESDENLPTLIGSNNLAFVVYTSGSTGLPKAVYGHEGALANSLKSNIGGEGLFTVDPSDRALLLFPVGSSSVVVAPFVRLMSGGSVVVPRVDRRNDLRYLRSLIAEHRVTEFVATSGLIRAIVDDEGVAACRSLRRVMLGGDASTYEVARLLLSRLDAELYNGLGVTEVGLVTLGRFSLSDAEGQGLLPIGRVRSTARAYVLDQDLMPVRDGEFGELCVGGAGVTRGYCQLPVQTAKSFVPDPFSDIPGARMYRTGDMVRKRPDGAHDYRGRADRQVKIRGVRIELAEIEEVLRTHSSVRDCAVEGVLDVRDELELVAYVVPKPGIEPDVTELRSFLLEKLPSQLVPAGFVRLDALPLVASKVDRTALRRRDAYSRMQLTYVAPRSPVEVLLAQTWSEILKAERVGVHDDFFLLGGHSLLATQVATRIHAVLGVKVPVRALFDAPTVAKLAERIAQSSGEEGSGPPLAKRPAQGPPTASYAQERLWFLDQLEGGSATYNVAFAMRIEGAVDAGILERVLSALVDRHATLRTTFVAIDGAPHQVIAPSSEVRLSRAEAASVGEARALAARESMALFDLANGPLLRATLVRFGAGSHLFAVSTHHIATDGWSTGILFREISALYGAFAAGKPSPLPPLAFDYADFAVWQRSWLTGDVLAKQLAFWTEHLAGAPAALELPTDRPRPAIRQNVGNVVDLAFPAETADGVRALCRREGVTPFMVFLAAYQVVLSRWSGQRDVVVGTAIANRMREEVEAIVGFFVNTLAIRTTIDAGASFVDVVRRVKQSSLSAYSHQDVPFEKLVDELKVVRDMSRTPVFQAFFVMQNTEIGKAKLADLEVHKETLGLDVAKFDLSLAIFETDAVFHGSLEYDVALFDGATMERFVEHLGIFLEAAMRTPDEGVAKLPLMSEAEKRRVLVEWNATAHPLSDVQTVHGMIEAQVERTPDAVAVEFEGRRLTYRELDERANRVAHWLLERGVALEDRVAVEVERSQDMLSAVLGVMKAGGAFVPVDAKLPEDRKRFMREDAGAKIALDDAALAQALGAGGAATRAVVDVRPENLAYVLYTSGSTGRPKGVMVEHANVANLLVSMAYEPGTGPDETTLSLTTLSFDVAVAELFLPLAFGAKVVVGSREASRDPRLIAAVIEATGARTFGATPTTWRMMVDSGWRPSAGMEIHCAGEALPRDLADALIERGATLWNLYGPTETTVYASGVEVGAGRITIGRPLRNTQFYVVDDQMQPVPIGVAGELCIGGAGVARGYLGRAELTAERFVDDPFAGRSGARMYRTGDLARWLPSGEVDYLGRLDHQVKIRGFRIELGEIESVLASIRGMRESVVLAREDTPGDKRLVAYVVAAADTKLDLDVVRAELGRSLAEYMVPSAFVVLPALPVTPSGKVDRNALPAPDFSAAATEYVPPRDATEEMLADIFRQLLQVERVGVHDDFFALGGHSLLATRVISRLREALGCELPVRTIFDAPTVALLAGTIDARALTREIGEI